MEVSVTFSKFKIMMDESRTAHFSDVGNNNTEAKLLKHITKYSELSVRKKNVFWNTEIIL